MYSARDFFLDVCKELFKSTCSVIRGGDCVESKNSALFLFSLSLFFSCTSHTFFY